MPGERGPVGKRSDKKLGHTSKAERESTTKVNDPFGVTIPPSDDDWHDVAKLWYESLSRSGQSAYYTNSDWGVAYVLAESMSRELKPQVVGTTDEGAVITAALPPKGASLAAWLKGMSALLATEGDRRRAAMELQRTPAPSASGQPAPVTDLALWRGGLSG